MFGLVLFTDEVLYVCDTEDITILKEKFSVKYGKKKYAARVLAVHVNDDVLKKIEQSLLKDDQALLVNLVIMEDKEIDYKGIFEISPKRKDATLYIEKTLVKLLSVPDEDSDLFSIVNQEKNFFANPSRFIAVSATFMEKKISDLFGDNAKFIENDCNELNNTLPNECEHRNIQITEEKNITSSHDLNMTYSLNISGIDCQEETSLSNINPTMTDDNYKAGSDTNPTLDDVLLFGKPKIISEEIITNPIIKFVKSCDNINLEEFTETIASHVLEYTTLQNFSPYVQPLPNNEVNMSDFNSSEPNYTIPILTSTRDSEMIRESNNSDKDYVAMDEDLSDSDESVYQSHRQSLQDKSSNQSLGYNKPGISAPDEQGLVVASSAGPSYLKRNYCFYCQKFQAKLVRHLETVHAKENDVQKFSRLPPKNAERKQIIATIRKKGNHLHNNDKRFNTGELLVCRRPNERMQKHAQDFIACGVCKGQYSKSVIRHHFRKCSRKSGKSEHLVMVSGRKVMARLHEKASLAVRKWIFPYLREDSIVRGIRYDELTILFANKQCEKYGTHQHHYQMIRARIRLLGRFLDNIRKINPNITCLSDVFVPRHYDNAVDAVRAVAGYNEENRTFLHPAVASNLGGLLKYCGDLLRSECIKRETDLEQKKTEDFLKLLAEGYGTSINRAATETQAQRTRRKKVVLPSTADIKKLDDHLKAESRKYFNILKAEFSACIWKKLAETTLLSLQIFNRRRPGEIERIYIEDYKNYEGIDKFANKEAYAALSEEGKQIANKYVRFEIRGKLGRSVPVLVHADIFECLELILHYRTDAGVPENNPYLFGLPGTDKNRCRYLRACNLMRIYAEKCNAQIPSTLRGTELRKHIATKCINLNLSDGQVADLANFMGHEEKIHRKIYRQPVIETDIVGMSKILKIAQGNIGASEESDSSGDSDIDDNVQTKKSKPSTQSQRWTSIQQETVLTHFAGILKTGGMPSGIQIQEMLNNEKCLEKKTVPQIRTWLHTKKKNLLARAT